MSGTLPTDKLRGMQRLHYVETEIRQLLEHVRPTLVVYESYALGVNKGMVFDIAELGGVIKKLIWEQGIPIMLVSPSSLKQAVYGSGGFGRGTKSKKDKAALVTGALRTRHGLLVASDDEADAVGLMLMGEVKSGKTKVHPKDALYKSHTCEVTRGRLF